MSEHAPSAAGDLQARRPRRRRDGPGRSEPPVARHRPGQAGSRPAAVAGPDRGAARARAARFSLGHGVLERGRRAGAARPRARRHPPDRGLSRAARASAISGWRLPRCIAGARRRHHPRSARAGATCGHRTAAPARRRRAAQRRSRREPRHRRAISSSLAHQDPQLARARAALQSHADDIIDGADMIRLAERELMAHSTRKRAG